MTALNCQWDSKLYMYVCLSQETIRNKKQPLHHQRSIWKPSHKVNKNKKNKIDDTLIQTFAMPLFSKNILLWVLSLNGAPSRISCGLLTLHEFSRASFSKKFLPYDHIHDEAVAQQADHEHHRVDRGDDGDDGRHVLLLPAVVVGHVAAAVRVSGHPGCGIHRTVLQRRGEALHVFFEYFNRSHLHAVTCYVELVQIF